MQTTMEEVGLLMDTTYGDANPNDMSDFADLLDSYYDFEKLERGDIRDAEILQITPNEIVVDLGVKRDGIVPASDIERMERQFLKNLRLGDTMPVYVLNPNDRDGNLLVSLNLGLQGQDWDRANGLLESEESVECEIIGYNKGGLLVQFNRIEGFVPESHLLDIPNGLPEDERSAAMKNMVGEVLELLVIEVNQKRRRLILSQREALKEWRTKQKETLLDELSVGDIVSGRITGIRDFGVFVDIGGADGLIHISEMAWHRVPHPGDVVNLGDEIDVYVLELDHEQKRIALSRKHTMPDPWEAVLETYESGQIVEGSVSNVVDFGAFVVLDDGIEGLLHLTEMAGGTLEEPYSYIKRGDRVSMQITTIEPERKRIGFTQKGLDIKNPAEETLPEEVIEPFEDSEESAAD